MQMASKRHGHVSIAQNGYISDLKPPVAAMDVAKELLKSGDWESAKKILEAVVNLEPTDFEALFQLGFICDVSHDEVGFATWIEKAVAVNPRHAQAWIYRGMVAERAGECEKAVSSYGKAHDLDPAGAIGQDGLKQIEMLRRNMGCPLRSRCSWAEAAHRIVAQQPRKERVHLKGHWLFPPRPVFRGEHSICVWDESLSLELLAQVRESVHDFSTYLHRNPRQVRTFWLSRDAAPKTAAELAGRILLEKVLGGRSEDFVGIEWWCKSQTANLGAHFHYDMAVADGGFYRPTYSSVLYLADEGGPTVVLDQAADLHHLQWPDVPQEGYVVMPHVNRWMVFPGELRHGMIPVDDDKRPRYVILYNFWTSHQPAAPNCQIPDFTNYHPISAKSPTARHLLSQERLEDLRKMEAMRLQPGKPGGPIPLAVETLERTCDMEDSSEFGEQAVALPMPSVQRMQSGPHDAAVLYLPWRRLAHEWLADSGNNALSGKVGRDSDKWVGLAERLHWWEAQGKDHRLLHCTPHQSEPAVPIIAAEPDGKTSAHTAAERPTDQKLQCGETPPAEHRLQRRAATIHSWLDSSFLAKAKELAEAEIIKAVGRGDGDCKLGLTSLARHVRDDLHIDLSQSELDGSFFMANPVCIKPPEVCDNWTLNVALFKVMQIRVDELCEQQEHQCCLVSDPKHGLVMLCSGLTRKDSHSS